MHLWAGSSDRVYLGMLLRHFPTSSADHEMQSDDVTSGTSTMVPYDTNFVGFSSQWVKNVRPEKLK